MNDELQLSTGKTVYANGLILGICPDLELSEGYDGGINERYLTPSELIEIADIAIDRWTRFRTIKIDAEGVGRGG